MKPWMVGDARGGAVSAKSVGKFLAPEILRKVLGDMSDARIGCERTQVFNINSQLSGRKRRCSLTARVYANRGRPYESSTLCMRAER